MSPGTPCPPELLNVTTRGEPLTALMGHLGEEVGRSSTENRNQNREVPGPQPTRRGQKGRAVGPQTPATWRVLGKEDRAAA